MEGLIPFIIMLILGSLFSSGKKKNSTETKKQAKPFTTEKQERDNPIKKLKEMSRDLYQEIQQEFEVEQEKTKPRPAVTPKEVVQKVETWQKEITVQPVTPVERKKSRGTVQPKEGTRQKKKQVKEKQLMPTSSDDIMKGIIFSEIIGPPKSKR